MTSLDKLADSVLEQVQVPTQEDIQAMKEKYAVTDVVEHIKKVLTDQAKEVLNTKGVISFPVVPGNELTRQSMTIDDLIKAFFNRKIIKHPQQPVAARYIPGQSKLVIVLGDNATGKSLCRRVFHNISSEAKLECMNFSVEAKTTASGFHSAIYGAESYDSTGRNAASLLLACLKNSRSWSNDNHSHTIIWDEPSLGLSDSWSASAGVAIKDFIKDAPTNMHGAFLITHSHHLLSQLLELNPHLIVLDETVTGLQNWLDKPIVIRPLSELAENNLKKYRVVQKVLDEIAAELKGK